MSIYNSRNSIGLKNHNSTRIRDTIYNSRNSIGLKNSETNAVCVNIYNSRNSIGLKNLNDTLYVSRSTIVEIQLVLKTLKLSICHNLCIIFFQRPFEFLNYQIFMTKMHTNLHQNLIKTPVCKYKQFI